MSITATVKVKSIGEISSWGEGWNKYMDVDVVDMDISGAVKADEIVSEFSTDDILEAIGESDVAAWLSEQGYSVSK
ncbi:hypothetical protein ACTE34_003753 [Cronobacter sakazakii]|uniref:hypothetical protein n=1 Tax=Cronobacter sakazakii TaxID=28141 RepID=UPI000CFE0514|nr:hypothetical protein [Cronobacter sakazakii]EJP5811104.1 hypothetical protein [Cronobacter sakazakii]EJX4168458.1 hypothetical protein [Cronobacter sakazakii]EJY8354809.1 hypothetical protein [Cronobacter sakazakii]EJY8376451.1 hypothetical protein [Cronobacter sakazakii]EKC5755646.1 hypothetical protein [Cronobacter sakazakii]